ncbi:Iron-sulfur cluster assembly 1, mitochondrial [Daphnia magna]|uniref:Iron-sulfur cluster assembly 2 homolog, mitochondrial n=2 Tax=Daphnia magna TaxID=35525 RepID=A0A0P5X7Q1_9CRUS|nr:hypothetical protein OUZ56_001846 [Daphnia magna]KZS21517.1 Iron-sulfur cluster assembly 1, mitochondrial [Daphnia magna]
MFHGVIGKTRFLSHIKSFSSAKNAVQMIQQTESVKMTEKCVKRLKELHEKSPEKTLRISVEGGGCSGFQYLFSLDTETTEDDCVVEKEGAKIHVDKDSMQYLEGATVDFQSELIRSAFRILKNPKAETGCSCGSSFSLKM